MKITQKQLQMIIKEEVRTILEQSGPGWTDSEPSGYFDDPDHGFDYKTGKSTGKPPPAAGPVSPEDIRRFKLNKLYFDITSAKFAVEVILRGRLSSSASGDEMGAGSSCSWCRKVGYEFLKHGFSDECVEGLNKKLISWMQKTAPNYSEYRRRNPKGAKKWEKRYINDNTPGVLALRYYQSRNFPKYLDIFKPAAAKLGWNIRLDHMGGPNEPFTDDDGFGRTVRGDLPADFMKKEAELSHERRIGFISDMICYLSSALKAEYDCGCDIA